MLRLFLFTFLIYIQQLSIANTAYAEEAANLPASPRVLVLGDSLSAAYGIELKRGWVYLLRERMRNYGFGDAVRNASTSGDTSFNALHRLSGALASFRPDLVIVELGGNDGLQALSLDALEENLSNILAQIQAHGSRALLIGIKLPPNYGKRYTERFSAIYPQLAKQFKIPLMPFLLDGIAQQKSLMQADGIHPTAAAQQQILENVWPYIKPLLQSKKSSPQPSAP